MQDIPINSAEFSKLKKFVNICIIFLVYAIKSNMHDQAFTQFV